MIRVGYLCEFSTLLGGERSLITFLNSARTLIEPIVVCPNSGDLVDALKRANIPCISWTRSTKKDDLAVFDHLQREGIEIIHGNSLSMAQAVHHAVERTHLPGVLHVRDIANLSERRWSIIRSIDRVIGVSRAVCDWITAAGIDESRLHLIYNAVDLNVWNQASPTLTRSELGLPPEGSLIACIGQICLRKGQDVFLRACERVAIQREDVSFLIIGERYSAKDESVVFERMLHDLSRSEVLSGRVHFLGYRHDVPMITRYVDLIVVPSRQEPLSRVLIESLASGVTCIASKVGGNGEIINDGDCGRLFTCDDDNELASCILDLLNDPGFHQRTKVNGPSFVLQTFSTSRQVSQIVDVYESILP
ncbi:glycosyltransferase family 4 protein [bacterium]|nr:glycosyltransferase family 4 protein [bacterium]